MSRPSSFRFIRAYRVTFSILLKYFGLYFIRKLLSEKRSQNLLEAAHEKTARKIVTNILQLKGLYIKIGQTLSIMTNFLPPSFTQGLEELQDSVTPHSYDEVKVRFQEEFQKSPEEMFASFESEPIAAASLGQVHVATLKDGTKLAVKLQYPGIDRLVEKDLKTIKKIFSLLHFLFPHYGIKAIYQECARIVLKELDFECEGKNLEQIQSHFQDKPQYIFPKIYWELSTKKILTCEFIEGAKVTHIDKLKEMNLDPHDVAVTLIHGYCQQIFIDGVYHADPHPGNIIIQAGEKIIREQSEDSSSQEEQTSSQTQMKGEYQPKVALIDYGATAQISDQMKAGMTLFIEGLIKKDTRVLSSAMKQMGFVAREDNDEAIEKIVEYFYSKIKGIKIDNFKDLNITDFQHLGDIFELKKMDISFKQLTSSFHVPQEWVLLERTLILMMGLVGHLDPHLNPVDIVVPYVEEFVLGKDKNIADLVMETSKELLLSYINLPTELSKVLKKLDQGKIVLGNKDQDRSLDRLYRGLHQMIYTLLLILSVSMGYLLDQQGNEEWVLRLKYISGVLAFLLALSLMKNR